MFIPIRPRQPGEPGDPRRPGSGSRKPDQPPPPSLARRALYAGAFFVTMLAALGVSFFLGGRPIY